MQRLETSQEASASRLVPTSSYFRSQFESEKYSVKGYTYPEDLMDVADYGYNKVVFYINVSVDSKALKTPGGEIQTVEGVQRDQRGELVGQQVTGVQGAAASAGAGAFAGGLGGKFLFDKGTKGAIAGAAGGAAAAGLIASNVNNQETAPGQTKAPTFSRPQKRLQAAIALYVPNQLSVRYSAGWSEEETFGFAAAAAAVQGGVEIGRALMGDANAKRSGGTTLDLVQSLSTATLLRNGGSLGLPTEAMGIAAGLAVNPKKEQAFKNVDFRTFTFEYLFAPKSESESKNVLDIIQAFKYHMHPEFKSADNFLYIYPSEFDITYYKGALENLAIHRHTSCVLTEFNVNYTPNGVFTTFPNGMPTQIAVTMTFKELMLLTKEAIERFA